MPCTRSTSEIMWSEFSIKLIFVFIYFIRYFCRNILHFFCRVISCYSKIAWGSHVFLLHMFQDPQENCTNKKRKQMEASGYVHNDLDAFSEQMRQDALKKKKNQATVKSDHGSMTIEKLKEVPLMPELRISNVTALGMCQTPWFINSLSWVQALVQEGFFGFLERWFSHRPWCCKRTLETVVQGLIYTCKLSCVVCEQRNAFAPRACSAVFLKSLCACRTPQACTACLCGLNM